MNTEVYDRNFLKLLMEDTFTAEINSTAALRLDNLNKKKFDFVKGELYRINLLFLLLIFEFENENVFVLSNDF